MLELHNLISDMPLPAKRARGSEENTTPIGLVQEGATLVVLGVPPGTEFGVDLNSCGDEDAARDSRQGSVRNARGSSALEGFPTHQKAWLGPLSKHSADAGVALLADGAQRWNRRVRSRKASRDMPSSIYAPGLVQAVEAARDLASSDCT